MIESYYWKQDLLKYAKHFKPLVKPPNWSEKLMVSFEKDVTIALFMVRKLKDEWRFSPETLKHKIWVYRYPCINKPNNFNYNSIEKLYNYDKEEKIFKYLDFISNQFIHSQAIYTFRGEDRNWKDIYLCSSYEKGKYIYKIPVNEIIKLLEIAGNDYPKGVSKEWNEEKKEYNVTTF